MDVGEAVKKRRARRTLDTKPIPDDLISELIETMRLSPSCNNNQPWRVAVVRSEEKLKLVKESLTPNNSWATRSPLIMVVSAKPSDDCRQVDGRDYYLFGCGTAVGEMLLRAVDLGIVAHCISGFDPSIVRGALNIPRDYVIISLLICGYSGGDDSLLSDKQKRDEKERPPRKPIGENFFAEEWGVPFERKIRA